MLLPILFHGLIGIVIVTRGKRNLLHYPYSGNIRYTLQRVTGVLAFAFILWHVFQMRGWLEIPWWREHVTRQLGGALFDYRNAAETAHRAIAASPIIIAAYVVGVLVSVYHLGNGLWTAGSTWGVWTSAAAGRRANFPCAAVGIVLLAVGLGALVGMLRVPAAGVAGEVAPRVAPIALPIGAAKPQEELPSATEASRASGTPIAKLSGPAEAARGDSIRHQSLPCLRCPMRISDTFNSEPGASLSPLQKGPKRWQSRA